MNASQWLRSIALGAAALLPAATITVDAHVIRQLTDQKSGVSSTPAMEDLGTEVFAGSSTNQFGSNTRLERIAGKGDFTP